MILADVESRSREDLKAVGGRLYWEHPSSEVLCVVLHDTDTEEWALWEQGDPCPVEPGTEIAAHNGQNFDRFAAARLGWPPITVDTSELARRAGLPGALDALGTRLLGIPKDKAVSKFTKGLSTCRRPSGKKNPDAIVPAVWKAMSKAEKRAKGVQKTITPEVMARVVPYCTSDVEIMQGGWPHLKPFLYDGVFGEWEADVSAVDRIINDRGMGFDVDLARRLLKLDERNQEKEFESAARELGMTAADVETIASSVPQFVAFTGAENAKAETVAAILRNESAPPAVRAMCRARQALASITGGKLRAGLAGVSRDGRLRDVLRYYGAHTGRWSGKRIQPHNFARPSKAYEKWGDAEICDHADRVGRSLHDVPPDMLDVLLRATVIAAPGNGLAVEDFSGVEARALAWCAGDTKALDVFRSGRNPYFVAAAMIFGKQYEDISKGTDEYDIGKKAELGCGYGMGPDKFETNYKPSKVGVDAVDIVASWRKLHAPIVKYWRRLNDAFVLAIQGVSSVVHPFEFVPSSDGNAVAIFLPSGRLIVYNGVGISRDRWADGRPKISPYYIGQKGREHLYGGKITENVIQALCRDLLAEAMIKAEEAGLCPVLHVHDELVVEQPLAYLAEASAELHQIMITLPEWAEGFPVGAAGHTGRRYRK